MTVKLRSDRRAISALIILVMVVVASVGAVAIGLMVLSYNDPNVSGGFSYDIELGSVVHDGAGRYHVSISSRAEAPYSMFDMVANNKTSKSTLAGMIGNESAWHVAGMSIYIDDTNANGNCDIGDRLVIIIEQTGSEKAVDIAIRNVKFGMELSDVKFVAED